jgi:hypothetical protein
MLQAIVHLPYQEGKVRGRRWAMEHTGCSADGLTARVAGTYDFGRAIEQVKAIDRAVRHYFGGDNWLAIRNRWFPGLV